MNLEERCYENTARVLDAFAKHRLSESHFLSVTGYGHNDLGREATDEIFAEVFQAEAALVRLQFVSGTHTISCALRACLQAGDTLVSLTGAPYDTLEEVIGKRGDSPMSLTAQGIHYQEGGSVESAKAVFIQRSRGYSLRPSLTIADLKTMIDQVRQVNPSAIVIVDNCYGEFVETQEPTAVGADLIVGSLIKNPGGGIVPTGGYIAGRKDLVEAAADALTAPGIGAKGGYTFEMTRTIMQGLYFAPSVVKEALKGMRLMGKTFQELGYPVFPRVEEPQADIIQVIQLGSAEKVLAFCKALQSVSPVDAHLTPIPMVTPGYADPVVMAGGTFIFGSTIELSCDAPMREPYSVFLQGGLTYSHTRYALSKILELLNEPQGFAQELFVGADQF